MNVIETGESVFEFVLGCPVQQGWMAFFLASILEDEVTPPKLP
ncbi:hypothetical protein [Burkholderia puraquae]|nr:hypothetical protein [Burkholderia puraquae]